MQRQNAVAKGGRKLYQGRMCRVDNVPQIANSIASTNGSSSVGEWMPLGLWILICHMSATDAPQECPSSLTTRAETLAGMVMVKP
jgi:hypothetical protein